MTTKIYLCKFAWKLKELEDFPTNWSVSITLSLFKLRRLNMKLQSLQNNISCAF